MPIFSTKPFEYFVVLDLLCVIPDSPTIWIPDKMVAILFLMYKFGIQMVSLLHSM